MLIRYILKNIEKHNLGKGLYRANGGVYDRQKSHNYLFVRIDRRTDGRRTQSDHKSSHCETSSLMCAKNCEKKHYQNSVS